MASIDKHAATKNSIEALKSEITRLEDKLDNHTKWVMTTGVAIFLMLVKLVFFSS